MLRRMCLTSSLIACRMLSIPSEVCKEIFYAFLPITDARGGMDVKGTWLPGLK